MSEIAREAGRLVREHLGGDADVMSHSRARSRLVEAATGDRPRVRPWVLATGAAAVVVIVAVVFGWRGAASEPAPIAFSVGAGESGRVGAYYGQPAAELPMRFSDGSLVKISAGSAARVARVDARGASVLVENGRAHVDVRHRPGSEWTLTAGPYSVLVTGTRFWIDWAADRGELELVMEEGSVIVRGPRAESGVPVTAGQRFVTRVIAELAAGPSAHAPPAPAAPSPAAQTPDPSPREPSPSAALSAGEPEAPPLRSSPSAAPSAGEPEVPPPEPSWPALAARGEHKKIVELAEKRGIDGVLANGTLDEVGTLADAARFSGKGSLAQRTLLALRQRFPGSARAKSAAFLLGRMVDDGGDPGAALRWYEVYLAESSGGGLAAEASGRRMVALQRLGRSGEAKQAAEAYLKHYPKGSYAARAEQLAAP